MIITNEYGTWRIESNVEVLVEGTETQKWIDEHKSEPIKQEPIISTEDKLKALEEAIVELTLKQLESGGTNGII